MSDAQGKALEHAKAAGERLRIEVDGEAVVTVDASTHVHLHTDEPRALLMASKLAAEGVAKAAQARDLAAGQLAILLLALGAVSAASTRTRDEADDLAKYGFLQVNKGQHKS